MFDWILWTRHNSFFFFLTKITCFWDKSTPKVICGADSWTLPFDPKCISPDASTVEPKTPLKEVFGSTSTVLKPESLLNPAGLQFLIMITSMTLQALFIFSVPSQKLKLNKKVISRACKLYKGAPAASSPVLTGFNLEPSSTFTLSLNNIIIPLS